MENLSDSEAIELCFEEAKKNGGQKTVVFDGKDYFIDRAILIPSNTEVIIDNCTIKQNDYVFDNIFRGDNLLINGIDPYGAPIDVFPINNIKIVGKGNAKLIGTDKNRIGYHPVFKEYQKMVGDFWGWRTIMCSFSYAKGIQISGLNLSQTMCWSTCFDNCQDVYVHDMEIYSHVKNGDGIDLRSGCNHCRIENIKGFTSDDSVACTALSRGCRYPALIHEKYLAPLEPYNSSHENIDGSIHDITIKNISTGGQCHGVICLSAWGNKIYNVEISNLNETNEGAREATVKVYTGYGDGYNYGDIHDITIKNITATTSKYAYMTNCDTANLTLENIVQNNPKGQLYCNLKEEENV